MLVKSFAQEPDVKNCLALGSRWPESHLGQSHPRCFSQGELPPSFSPAVGTALLHCSGLQVALLLAG